MKTARHFPGLSWLEYDLAYRKDAAASGLTDWSRKNIIFHDNNGYKQRYSAHQSRNEDNFATFSLGVEFLNEAEKEKNNGNFA